MTFLTVRSRISDTQGKFCFNGEVLRLRFLALDYCCACLHIRGIGRTRITSQRGIVYSFALKHFQNAQRVGSLPTGNLFAPIAQIV